ncbi:hypothetical protein LJ707_02165 [Mucilaginibacter sp. UR6-1]|uniref:hypothetical protein n=1 Tax=Mucilaginibacter sp. UR6-1 TaxID=1435643 RepID=UPI001E2DA79F|nr:hypothetical protein [Mucilaginibacter sp. UR6-1]MCC8407716.1 hypothetical protein [Mucilaginibacter sp. UR6-1]
MNWMKFILWLSVIYLAYYGAVLLWDFLRSGKLPPDEKSEIISFDEDAEPAQEISAPQPEIYDASVLSSGGVSLKQLFSLAREEAIEYIRPVSF